MIRSHAFVPTHVSPLGPAHGPFMFSPRPSHLNQRLIFILPISTPSMFREVSHKSRSCSVHARSMSHAAQTNVPFLSHPSMFHPRSTHITLMFRSCSSHVPAISNQRSIYVPPFTLHLCSTEVVPPPLRSCRTRGRPVSVDAKQELSVTDSAYRFHRVGGNFGRSVVLLSFGRMFPAGLTLPDED